MAIYNTSLSSLQKRQEVILPTYQLDSNLVLLPGIIYNVTFSRFKAAALLSRYKERASGIKILRDLVNEYEFNEESKTALPSTISLDAIQGIETFHAIQFNNKSKTSLLSNEDHNLSDFDWLVIAIEPNTDKIKYPDADGTHSSNGVLTISRIIGIVDETSNVRLTIQALIRGSKVEGFNSGRTNEKLIEVDRNYDVPSLDSRLLKYIDSADGLFQSIDEFMLEYRKALATATTAQSKNEGRNTNLLCLNPLANALFLQLGGSKDFSKAYTRLQKLYGTLKSNKTSIESKSGLRLLDLTCAIIPFPNHDKLNFLNIFSPKRRFSELGRMNERLKEVFENLKADSCYMNHWFYSEASNIQRAKVVANQLKSIRLVLEGISNDRNSKNVSQNRNKLIRRPNSIPLGARSNEEFDEDGDNENDEDDELRLIANFVNNKLPHISTLLSDTKRLIAKDFKRIKTSPPGNSDYHVIRNYLEIVADIPWDKYVSRFRSNKDIDIVLAKKQLDDDHYGLENVKKRLIQYLVVLKLLGMSAEERIEEKSELQKDDAQKLENKPHEDSIVIPDNDETIDSKEAARNKYSTAKSAIRDTVQDKALIVSKNNKSPIIMLAGPPGTGKTSLAKSIAKSLGRKYQRISLGGVKDESEIRGHRRTYVGAMPGVIVQALRKSGSMNPVILLDEIDKVIGGSHMANKFNGDPSAALLEVLDPEQNTNFTDHYLGFPVDLSQVIFICTANEPHNMSKPLLDRLEMIEVGAYDYKEKLIIGSRYLLPRQIKRNGLPSLDLVQIRESVMKKIIIDYTREAGVRGFERKLGTVCRYKAVEYAQGLEEAKADSYNAIVEEYDLPKYLGIPFPSMSSEIIESPLKSSKYGVVNGLSYNSEGSGSVLVFESVGFSHESSKGSLNMTGRLGEVLMESAKIGLTFIKLIIFRDLLNVSTEHGCLIERFNNLEIHLHVPLGSISKDGPSAGITMALLFLSLILERPVPYDIAMTGEITLRGLVLPIGGLKEKLLGAHLSGIKRVIAPRENRKDLIEEYVKNINDDTRLNQLLKDNENKYDYRMKDPERHIEQRYGIKMYYATEFWDVIKVVWGDDMLVKVDQSRMLEYHF
ncbi:uncharacterized protein PRCAT00000300001 [Priceomyces carsonii]|uniref:uncharacterized protein n=1 Tax=Priceomyces carsonii TaxID=28549 RepID=UPI002ED9C70D|nr:unnamed protein product [Priceomyces carsonii]